MESSHDLGGCWRLFSIEVSLKNECQSCSLLILGGTCVPGQCLGNTEWQWVIGAKVCCLLVSEQEMRCLCSRKSQELQTSILLSFPIFHAFCFFTTSRLQSNTSTYSTTKICYCWTTIFEMCWYQEGCYVTSIISILCFTSNQYACREGLGVCTHRRNCSITVLWDILDFWLLKTSGQVLNKALVVSYHFVDVVRSI